MAVTPETISQRSFNLTLIGFERVLKPGSMPSVTRGEPLLAGVRWHLSDGRQRERHDLLLPRCEGLLAVRFESPAHGTPLRIPPACLKICDHADEVVGISQCLHAREQRPAISDQGSAPAV